MRILVVGERDVWVAPMAAALLYHERRLRSLDDLEVASAGRGRPGHRIAGPVAELLEDRGIDVSRKRSRALDSSVVVPADLVLVTRHALAERVAAVDPASPAKTRHLDAFCSAVEPRNDRVTTSTWLRSQLHRTGSRVAARDGVDLVAPDDGDPLALLEVADRVMTSVGRLVAAAWPTRVTDPVVLTQSSSRR